MAGETELKLLLDAGDRDRLVAHPWLRAQPSDRRLLRNTYFDTTEGDLTRQRMAVRERQVDGQTWLTVKTAGESAGGLSRRGEWEGPTEPGVHDFGRLVDDAELAQALCALAPRLRPVFRTDFWRQRWTLSHAGAQIELALDEGEIARLQAPVATQALLELELELLDGPESALWDLAQALQTGPAGVRLTPSDLSKAARGVALWQAHSTPG